MTELRSRRVRVVAILVAVMLGIILLVVPSIAADNGATVIRDGRCTMFGPSGDPEDVVTVYDAMVIVTQSAEGTLFKKCEYQFEDPPEQTIHYDFYENPEGFDLYCDVQIMVGGEPIGDITSNWQQTISPSGMSTLICQFNPSGS